MNYTPAKRSKENLSTPPTSIVNENEVMTSNYQAEVDAQRAVAEVQAQLTIAKRFPRNELQCIDKINQACKRRKLAEKALYSYPRGGQQVTGPSIRFAETLARYWGNLSCGIKEISRDNGGSIVRAYCNDLETNVSKSIDFHVAHIRDSKKGATKLTDQRDIYEITANMGARRLRNCILAIIPQDVQDEAMEVCERTLESSEEGISIQDRIKKMMSAFSELNVNQQMLEGRLGHKLEVTTPAELVSLQKIYRSIKDQFADASKYFDLPKSKSEIQNLSQVEQLTGEINGDSGSHSTGSTENIGDY